MNELFSYKKAAKIFDVSERQLRYWAQIGLVNPSARNNGPRYTREDLNRVKVAVDLIGAGKPLDTVRAELLAMRRSDDEHLAEVEQKVRVLFDCHVAVALEPVPEPVEDDPTEHHEAPTAYGYFRDGCRAEDRGQLRMAAECYRRALDLEPGFAAALTNLGNLRYRSGAVDEARTLYERALEIDPTQPEARYNLGNVLEDLGETDHAIAELRRVCSTNPDFADAHFNLGLILARVGGVTQARAHLSRYIELDPQSVWARRSQELLAGL